MPNFVELFIKMADILGFIGATKSTVSKVLPKPAAFWPTKRKILKSAPAFKSQQYSGVLSRTEKHYYQFIPPIKMVRNTAVMNLELMYKKSIS